MTGQEFLDNFNLSYNNIMSNQSPGLDETEIAMVLTQAELELVKDYFNPKSNNKQEGFAGSTKRDLDFSPLIKTINLNINGSKYIIDNTDVLFILSETYNNKPIYLISPSEYTRILRKPYPYPPKRFLWKVATNTYEYKLISAEAVTDDSMVEFSYVKIPKQFESDFYIQDNPCELPEYMHPEIIQRAIEIAKTIWVGDLNSVLAAGQRTE